MTEKSAPKKFPLLRDELSACMPHRLVIPHTIKLLRPAMDELLNTFSGADRLDNNGANPTAKNPRCQGENN